MDREKQPPKDHSKRMAQVRRRDTAPELEIRRELHRRGLRYRTNLPIVEAGRTQPDIVFTKARLAIFVDGCFWHRCPEHKTDPKTNSEWWASKLQRNVDRDERINELLEQNGWTVLRIWEHVDHDTAVNRIERALAKLNSD